MFNAALPELKEDGFGPGYIEYDHLEAALHLCALLIDAPSGAKAFTEQ